MVDVDPIDVRPEGNQGVALRGEVLPIGRNPSVADLERAHRTSVSYSPPSPGFFCGRVLRERRSGTDQLRSTVTGARLWVSRKPFPYCDVSNNRRGRMIAATRFAEGVRLRG